MDLRIGTTTAPAVVTETPAPLAERYVGDLVAPDGSTRPQPLFAGERLGSPDGYADAREAAHALAERTDGAEQPAAVLVQRPGSDRVDAYVLEAPVWKKTFFRTEVVASTPAFVDGTDEQPGGLDQELVARAGDGSVSGALRGASYGTPLGTVVGVVDDTWGRLQQDTVDLGRPFAVDPPSVSGVSKPESRYDFGIRLDRVGRSLEEVAGGLNLFSEHPRDLADHQIEQIWSAVREGIAKLEKSLDFDELPSTIKQSMERAITEAKTVDAQFERQGRLTRENAAWAANAADGVDASARELRAASQSPWITDLPRDEVARMLTTALTAADSRIGRSIGQLLAIPKKDADSERFLPLRKEARSLNLAAQEQFETLIDRKGMPKAVVSALRSADASLEDATWQIVGKPSPDGRFNGLDLPGAIDSTRTARNVLRELAGEYGVELGKATEPKPDVPKPKPTPTPAPTPTPDPKPAPGVVDPIIVRDVKAALKLLASSESSLAQIPNDAYEAETWLPARKSARQDNLDAQKLIEDRFLDLKTPAAIESTLRRADATLEDVTWQIVGKPSPDGRFNGVDIPGAIRDTQAAIKLLEGILAA